MIRTTSLTDTTIQICLEDGSEIRFKTDIIEVVRIPDCWDFDGNPAYNVRSSNSMVVLDSPDKLKRPNNGSA
ncbi:MAG: hypothetical protein OXD33_06925 [Rhodobacteraceae bacterium]|nr:hypothetical protein [Paracoccaceae bacterium]